MRGTRHSPGTAFAPPSAAHQSGLAQYRYSKRPPGRSHKGNAGDASTRSTYWVGGRQQYGRRNAVATISEANPPYRVIARPGVISSRFVWRSPRRCIPKRPCPEFPSEVSPRWVDRRCHPSPGIESPGPGIRSVQPHQLSYSFPTYRASVTTAEQVHAASDGTIQDSTVVGSWS